MTSGGMKRRWSHEEIWLGRFFSAHFSGNPWTIWGRFFDDLKDDLVAHHKPTTEQPCAWISRTNALGAFSGWFSSEEKTYVGNNRLCVGPPATGEKCSCRAIVSVDSGAQRISAGEFDATTFEVQTSDSRFSVILKNAIFKHSSSRYSKTSLYGFPNVLDMFFL